MGQELTQITSIHDSIATWREDSKYLNYIITYPRDMSTPSISTMCPVVAAESSTSFKASSSLQVTAKPSPATSKSTSIQHLRSSGPGGGLIRVGECYRVIHQCLQGIKLDI
jgi:hypothetical protein